MVKIVHKPFKEVVILDYSRYPLDTLVSLHGLPMLAGNIVPPLNWAEGIVFIHEGMPHEESTLEEMREHGRIYLPNVAFAEMPKYQPTATTKDGRVTVNILDKTSHPVFKDVAKWLKTQSSK